MSLRSAIYIGFGKVSCSLGLVHFATAKPFALRQYASFSLPCLGSYHWFRTESLLRLAALRFLTRDTYLPFASSMRAMFTRKNRLVHCCEKNRGTRRRRRVGRTRVSEGFATAGVVSLGAAYSGEGNGLSRFIDLRVRRWSRYPERTVRAAQSPKRIEIRLEIGAV